LTVRSTGVVTDSTAWTANVTAVVPSAFALRAGFIPVAMSLVIAGPDAPARGRV
jgi:hypothetical protein